MAKQYSSQAVFAGNWQIGVQAPLDTRSVFTDAASLLVANNWKVNGLNTAYKGMFVTLATGDAYVYIGTTGSDTDVANSAKWVKLAKGSDALFTKLSNTGNVGITGAAGNTSSATNTSYNLIVGINNSIQTAKNNLVVGQQSTVEGLNDSLVVGMHNVTNTNTNAHGLVVAGEYAEVKNDTLLAVGYGSAAEMENVFHVSNTGKVTFKRNTTTINSSTGLTTVNASAYVEDDLSLAIAQLMADTKNNLVKITANTTNITTNATNIADLTKMLNATNDDLDKIDLSVRAIDDTVAGHTNQISDLNVRITNLGSVYRIKGSVASYANLPKDATVGDVYNCTDTNMNYVCTAAVSGGAASPTWDPLGATINLTWN